MAPEYPFPTPKTGDFYNAMSSLAGEPTTANSGRADFLARGTKSLGKKLSNILEKIVDGEDGNDPLSLSSVSPSLKSALNKRGKIYGLMPPED